MWPSRSGEQRPRWIVLVRAAKDGFTLRTDERALAVGTVGTILTMSPRPRGWRDASVELSDGTTIYARRRAKISGGCEFIFDRPLPEGSQIVLSGRAVMALPNGARLDAEQWWERG